METQIAQALTRLFTHDDVATIRWQVTKMTLDEKISAPDAARAKKLESVANRIEMVLRRAREKPRG